MSDIIASMGVIALTGIFIGALFYFLQIRKKNKAEALARFCQAEAIALRIEENRLSKKTFFSRGKWQIVAELTSTINTAETGSSEWSGNTILTATPAQPDHPVFVMGSCPSAENFDLVPDWIQANIVTKLRYDLNVGEDFAPEHFARSIGRMSFIAFAPDEASATAAYASLEPFLAAWPAQIPLTIFIGPEQIRIQLLTHYLQEIPLLRQLIALGEHLIVWK